MLVTPLRPCIKGFLSQCRMHSASPVSVSKPVWPLPERYVAVIALCFALHAFASGLLH